MSGHGSTGQNQGGPERPNLVPFRSRVQNKGPNPFTYQDLKNDSNPIIDKEEPPDNQRIRDPFTTLDSGFGQKIVDFGFFAYN